MTLVRPMVPRDVEALVALHGEVLDMEFLTRYGPPFLRTYYRAWIDAPGGIALTAVDERDRVLGGLLGAVDPAQHVHAMLRRHGGALGVRIIARAATHPQLARDLLVTRGRRYARGVVRMLARRLRRNDTSESPEAPRTAEITHVLVAADAQGSGRVANSSSSPYSRPCSPAPRNRAGDAARSGRPRILRTPWMGIRR